MNTFYFHELYIIGMFTSVVLVDVIDVSRYLKKLFKIKAHQRVNLIDCLPCMTFWITLALTFNPLVAMSTYLTAILIDTLRNR